MELGLTLEKRIKAELKNDDSSYPLPALEGRFAWTDYR